MNDLQVFDYGQGEIRTVMIDGEPWFVAKDIAEALEYRWNGSAMISHVPEEWRGVTSVLTPSGNQDMAVLSEQGLYFFLGRSDKKAALPMQKWVAGKVLPQIRKTGSYGMDPMKALNDPATMRQLLLTYSEKVIALEETVNQQKPKVIALDRLSTANGSMCITDAAKTLQIQPKILFRWMSADGWIYKRAGGYGNWIAYQRRLQQGVLEHKTTTVTRGDGSEKTTFQVLVTPKGLAVLSEKLSIEENIFA
jgi:anti-repressor protein